MADIHPRHEHPEPPFKKQSLESPGLDSELDPKPDFGEHSYKGYDRLKGVVALITGGDSGIGKAVSLAFAREGADVAINYLPEEEQDAKETQRVVEGAGRKCLLLPGDLSQEGTCKKLVQGVVDKFGRIDCLVNNAAFQGKAVDKFEEMDHERVVYTFNVNIIAMFDLTRYALAHMKEGSTIINTSSIQAYKPGEYILDYACTKAAIVAFTKGLSQELIERGIRVNSVAPGPVWTPLPAASFSPEKMSKFGTQAPTKRPAQPAELAPAYVFLASRESTYITGETIGVTGGEIVK